MTSPLTAFWAGVGTVIVALTVGFGGGILIAEYFGSSTAVPEASMSRVGKVMSSETQEKPSPQDSIPGPEVKPQPPVAEVKDGKEAARATVVPPTALANGAPNPKEHSREQRAQTEPAISSATPKSEPTHSVRKQAETTGTAPASEAKAQPPARREEPARSAKEATRGEPEAAAESPRKSRKERRKQAKASKQPRLPDVETTGAAEEQAEVEPKEITQQPRATMKRVQTREVLEEIRDGSPRRTDGSSRRAADSRRRGEVITEERPRPLTLPPLFGLFGN